MTRISKQTLSCDEAMYEIRLRGHLSQDWSGWFAELGVSLQDNGDTLLVGRIVDQSALHGLLRKIRDLGIPLLSVNRLASAEKDASDTV